MSAEADISDFLRRMQQMERQVLDAAARALSVVAEDIVTEAKRRCPLDTGDLQKSHYVGPVKVMKDNITVELGANMTYAAVVHENLEQPLRTEKNPAAEHKWLENAINARREKGLQYIADQIRTAQEKP